MISLSNIQKIPNLEFETYKQMPGYSFSFLKREKNGFVEEIRRTDKVELGTLVDAILTGKPDMGHKLYRPAKKIAHKLQQQFGDMINIFEKQVSFTADMTCGEFTMPVKGRPDFLLRGHAVIDLKITAAKNVQGVIDFMQYPDQLWGYGRMAGVMKGYLMIYSTPLDEVFLKGYPVYDYNDFWQNKIYKFGSAA